MVEKIKIYYTKKDIDRLSKQIIKYNKIGVAIGASNLFKKIKGKNVNRYNRKRNKLTVDDGRLNIAARITSNDINIAFYSPNIDYPIILSYVGNISKVLMKKLGIDINKEIILEYKHLIEKESKIGDDNFVR